MAAQIGDGVYRAKAKSGTLSKASTGKEQAVVELEFLDIDELVTLNWYGYFTDATIERTIETLRTCGWIGDDLADLSSIDGRAIVYATVKTEEYNGKLYSKVAFINKTPGMGVKEPLDQSHARSFAAQMRAKVAAIDAKAGRKPVTGAPRPPNSPAPKQPDDDIPF